MQIFRKHPDLTACLVLSILVLGITLPFLNHAYHIDEPLFLRIAQQIKEHPFNPYGFWYLWNLKYEPMHQIAAFSPVFSYYLALVSWPFRFPPEWLIHLSLIPFNLIAILSLYALIREFDFPPFESFLGATLMAVSPAFVLSANLAMPDVTSVGFALFSVVLAIHGWKQDHLGFLFFSGVILSLATLMRYNAVPLILVLFLLGLTFSNTKKAILPSLVCFGILACWTSVNILLTGGSHTSEVISIFAKTQGWMSRFWSMNIHLVLTTFIPFLAILFWWRKGIIWILLLSFIAIDFAIYASGGIKQFALLPDILFFILGLATFILLGILFFQQIRSSKIGKVKTQQQGSRIEATFSVRKLSDYRNNLDFRYSALFVWIISVLFIPLIYVHFAPKYLLIAQAPLILILLHLAKSNQTSFKGVCLGLLPIMLFFSMLVTASDFSYADIYRKEAELIAKQEIQPGLLEIQSPGRVVWFTGHWGWQYYLEKAGALALPYDNLKEGGPVEGDILITSKHASAHDIHPRLLKRLNLVDQHIYAISYPILTMSPLARSGFYSNHWGPLPYNFSHSPAEEFDVYEMLP